MRSHTETDRPFLCAKSRVFRLVKSKSHSNQEILDFKQKIQPSLTNPLSHLDHRRGFSLFFIANPENGGIVVQVLGFFAIIERQWRPTVGIEKPSDRSLKKNLVALRLPPGEGLQPRGESPFPPTGIFGVGRLVRKFSAHFQNCTFIHIFSTKTLSSQESKVCASHNKTVPPNAW